MLKGALIVSAWCVLLVVGRPQAPVANAGTPAVAAAGAATTANKAPTGNVSVVKDARDPLDGKGAYKYDIELSDGTKFEQEGATEAPGMGETEPSVVIKGSYSYVSPDGTPVNIMYIANKDGFQPTGDVIPKDTNSKAGQAGAPGAVPLAASSGSSVAAAPVAVPAQPVVAGSPALSNAAPVAAAAGSPAPLPVAA